MNFKSLGRTGLKVSRLCLGTMNFGQFVDEKGSFSIMDKALEVGINFFDTANVYGGKMGDGVTETIIGKWISQGGGRREKIVLATKVYGRMGEGSNDRKLSAYHIRRACEDSLRRLQTDHIDLYQMHHIDRETPWEEIWQAMELLVQQGKILYVGSSNFAGWHIAMTQWAASKRNFLGLVSEQCLYNLRERSVELEILPACRALGIGVIPYSPLSGGILGGITNRPSQGRRNSERLQDTIDKQRGQFEAFESICQEMNTTPASLALAWLLKNPAVTAPIIGPRTIDQLTDSLPSLDIEITDEQMAQLDQIWPGPGGEAPEAFAW
jgi:aryl-alcohol dehydrogenase-like predicted oxidoreductase